MKLYGYLYFRLICLKTSWKVFHFTSTPSLPIDFCKLYVYSQETKPFSQCTSKLGSMNCHTGQSCKQESRDSSLPPPSHEAVCESPHCMSFFPPLLSCWVCSDWNLLEKAWWPPAAIATDATGGKGRANHFGTGDGTWWKRKSHAFLQKCCLKAF